MRHLGWLFLFVAAVGAMWWAGLKALAVLVTVVCGLAGVASLVVRSRRTPPLLWAERERDPARGRTIHPARWLIQRGRLLVRVAVLVRVVAFG
jgi:hypothetical protein